MRRPFLIQILGGILWVGILVGPGQSLTAQAAEYHNPAVAGEESPSYWLDRGGLLATYGNYAAAIKAYQKALALDAGLSTIYFNLALAYCETGAYDQAQAAINRAVGMEPENGRYLYGRGWILLHAQGTQQALADFQKAAQLGNQDALAYLQGEVR